VEKEFLALKWYIFQKRVSTFAPKCFYIMEKHHLSTKCQMAAQLKASASYSFQKTFNVNKTCQLKPRKVLASDE